MCVETDSKLEKNKKKTPNGQGPFLFDECGIDVQLLEDVFQAQNQRAFEFPRGGELEDGVFSGAVFCEHGVELADWHFDLVF